MTTGACALFLMGGRPGAVRSRWTGAAATDTVAAVDAPILDAAVAAVVDATRVCRFVSRELGRLRTVTKHDNSPVTVADFASQAVVVRRLQVLGQFPVLAEESADALLESGESMLAEVVRAARVVWPDAEPESVVAAIGNGGTCAATGDYFTLDPIDGTKGFLRAGQYAVSLGLVSGGTPVLGVLGCPNLSRAFSRSFDDPDPEGTLYFARAGHGLYEAGLQRPDLQRPIVPASAHQDVVHVAESVESGHSRHDATSRILVALGKPSRTLRLDSQVKYAVCARGQADAYLRIPTKPGYREAFWDHVAGVVIAREGGCTVTDTRGRDLDFSQPPRLTGNLGIVCARGALHARLLDIIDELALIGPDA